MEGVAETRRPAFPAQALATAPPEPNGRPVYGQSFGQLQRFSGNLQTPSPQRVQSMTLGGAGSMHIPASEMRAISVNTKPSPQHRWFFASIQSSWSTLSVVLQVRSSW